MNGVAFLSRRRHRSSSPLLCTRSDVAARTPECFIPIPTRAFAPPTQGRSLPRTDISRKVTVPPWMLKVIEWITVARFMADPPVIFSAHVRHGRITGFRPEGGRCTRGRHCRRAMRRYVIPRRRRVLHRARRRRDAVPMCWQTAPRRCKESAEYHGAHLESPLPR